MAPQRPLPTLSSARTWSTWVPARSGAIAFCTVVPETVGDQEADEDSL